MDDGATRPAAAVDHVDTHAQRHGLRRSDVEARSFEITSRGVKGEQGVEEPTEVCVGHKPRRRATNWSTDDSRSLRLPSLTITEVQRP